VTAGDARGRLASTSWAKSNRGHRVSYLKRSSFAGGVAASGGAAAAAGGAGAGGRAAGYPAFFAPFAPHFHPVVGPSTPIECYLRLMFLKFRYRLGYESLCAEVSDSISSRRFYRIRLDGKVPHPATLMKLINRCGAGRWPGQRGAAARAAGQKLLRSFGISVGRRRRLHPDPDDRYRRVRVRPRRRTKYRF
jgi:hypothetical protein